ncbi:hypothetical protein P4V86_07960 [Brevibacillus laterosporus]|uniref:hypothetical protein n=1 Tax=Brevibacillus laterosporus TaxID=1465 RepID=UPI000369AECA|nr:hypothetical protein [Brevibacillus laterosporus]ATO49617.1 hypothetical protein BrL25_11160 [Brevibacillus laterosporus DSM 25]MBG9787041.1 hypothetical protein [Brevibacillus laterosporus]MBG9801098.1 hypothetical protein [Brevibacillus laterosporus]MCG7318961.1 hypothetical protein [Brevibacillus laterosporus]MED2003285.1 hypothetical protein [Brevibacillus laterosporus]
MKKIIKPIIAIFSAAILMLPSMAMAQETNVEKTIPKIFSEQSLALEKINQKIESRQTIQETETILNQPIEETYSYTHSDGGITTVTMHSIIVPAGEEENVILNTDGSYSLKENKNTLVPEKAEKEKEVTKYQSGEVRGTYLTSHYTQKIYGKWTYIHGKTGSLKNPGHNSPPTASGGIGMEVGEPKAFTTMLSGKSAAHIGSTCKFTLKGGNLIIFSKDHRAVLVVDINGNYRFVDDSPL